LAVLSFAFLFFSFFSFGSWAVAQFLEFCGMGVNKKLWMEFLEKDRSRNGSREKLHPDYFLKDWNVDASALRAKEEKSQESDLNAQKRDEIF
jgi:hypothetical protein